MKTTRLAIFIASLAAIGLAPAAHADSFDLHVGTGDVSVGVDVGEPPPVPIYEAVPPPRVGYIWAPGYWGWEGHRHVWMPGVWQADRPGYVYAPGRWEQRGDRWHFEPGRWNRHEEMRERRHEEHEMRREERYEEHYDHGDRGYHGDHGDHGDHGERGYRDRY